jgi:hypothetical protein
MQPLKWNATMSIKNYTKQSPAKLAKAICAGEPLNLSKFGLVYRKGKTIQDILTARSKSIVNDKQTEEILKTQLVEILKKG